MSPHFVCLRVRVASVAPALFVEHSAKEFTVRLKNLICFGILAAFALGASGCGPTDPTANLPPEKKAPDPMQLGNDPEYSKKFGGDKKK